MPESSHMSSVDRKQAERMIPAAHTERSVNDILSRLLLEDGLFHIKILSKKEYPFILKQLHIFGHVYRTYRQNIKSIQHVLNELIPNEQNIPDTPIVYFNALLPGTFYYDRDKKCFYLWDGQDWNNNLRKSKGESGFCGSFMRTGFAPDSVIYNSRLNKIFFIESKNQGAAGNAQERACKYFTPVIRDMVISFYNLTYFPVGLVMTGNMVNDPDKVGYIREAENYFMDHPNHLVIWKDTNDSAPIKNLYHKVLVPVLTTG